MSTSLDRLRQLAEASRWEATPESSPEFVAKEKARAALADFRKDLRARVTALADTLRPLKLGSEWTELYQSLKNTASSEHLDVSAAMDALQDFLSERVGFEQRRWGVMVDGDSKPTFYPVRDFLVLDVVRHHVKETGAAEGARVYVGAYAPDGSPAAFDGSTALRVYTVTGTQVVPVKDSVPPNITKAMAKAPRARGP